MKALEIEERKLGLRDGNRMSSVQRKKVLEGLPGPRMNIKWLVVLSFQNLNYCGQPMDFFTKVISLLNNKCKCYVLTSLTISLDSLGHLQTIELPTTSHLVIMKKKTELIN